MKGQPIGIEKPRLDRTRAWGFWYVSRDGRTLVYDRPESGNYQVNLAELQTLDDCTRRVEKVIAVKDGWVDQRVVDDLVRALRELVDRAVPRATL